MLYPPVLVFHAFTEFSARAEIRPVNCESEPGRRAPFTGTLSHHTRAIKKCELASDGRKEGIDLFLSAAKKEKRNCLPPKRKKIPAGG